MRQLKITYNITRKDEENLEKYFQEISKKGLITPEQEVELAQKIKKGDKKALEKLVNSNLRFVISIAKKFQNKGLPLSDLINEGNIGLIKAAEKYDETKGFKFVSYAVWWIRQSMLQSLAEYSRIIRLPLNQIARLNKINKNFSKLEQEYQREPTYQEILNEDKTIKSESFNYMNSKGISLDKKIEERDDDTLLNITKNPNSPPPDENFMKESLKKDLLIALNQVSPRNRKILKRYYLEGKSYEEIGKEINLGRERVRQLAENGIRRLRKKNILNYLREYL